MDISIVIEEYDKLRHQAERLVAAYFGVSGYIVANVHFDNNEIVALYYDVGCPKEIRMPKTWLDLTDEELIKAVKEYSLKKHEEYMAWQQEIMAQQQIEIENREKAKLAELKAKYE